MIRENILCFASFPDHQNTAVEKIALPITLSPDAQLLDWLRECCPRWEQYLAEDDVQDNFNRALMPGYYIIKFYYHE